MTTSLTYTFDRTRDQIISRALRIIGVLDAEGGTPTATQLTNGAEALNTIIKGWSSLGLLIWTRKFLAIPLLAGKAVYQIGPTTSDTLYQVNTRTTLSSAASSGAGSITVTSSQNIANTNGIGVQLTSGKFFWTTVNGAPAGNVVTLSSVLSGAASQYGVVIAGQAPSRVTKIKDGYLTQVSGSDVPITIIPKEQYNRFGVKTSTGTTTQVYYDPQLSYGILHIYPVHNVADCTLFLEAEAIFQDFNAAGDNPDFPSEWLGALVWNLASELAMEYGVTENRLKFITAKGMETLDKAQWTSQEESVYFQPDRYRQ